MQRENHQKLMGKNEKCIYQNNHCDPIIQATATISQSEIYRCLQEDIMVAAMV